MINTMTTEPKFTTCKALSKMYTQYTKWYVPQWDEIREKIIFVESNYPKCVGMDVDITNYDCYELPEDAELLILSFQIIP